MSSVDDLSDSLEPAGATSEELPETSAEPRKKKKATPTEKLWGAVPDSPLEQFTYKPWCETCVAKSVCTGCIYPRCRWCFSCEGRGQGPSGRCNCAVRCKSTTIVDQWIQQIGSFDVAPMVLSQPPLALPRFIPIVNPNVPVCRQLPPWTYTIPVHTIIRQSDGNALPIVRRLREQFAPGSQFILNFCCPDEFIEPIWGYSTEWWSRDFLREFDMVCAVNFSVYWDDPMFEMLSAIARTMVVTEEIAAAGHRVIPLVIWYTEKETREQLDVLAANGVHTIICNFQYVSGAQIASYRHDLQILEMIAKYYPNLRVICYGMAAAWVIHRAREILGERLIIANGDAFYSTVRAATSDKRGFFASKLRYYMDLVENGADPNRHWLRPLGIEPPNKRRVEPEVVAEEDAVNDTAE